MNDWCHVSVSIGCSWTVYLKFICTWCLNTERHRQIHAHGHHMQREFFFKFDTTVLDVYSCVLCDNDPNRFLNCSFFHMFGVYEIVRCIFLMVKAS